MRRNWKKLLMGLAAAGALMLSSGCAVETHAEAKQKAYNRWAEARAGILFSMARQQFEVGDLDQAERTCKQGIAAKPDQADFYELLARVLVERGELERAHHHLGKALSLDDSRSSTHYLLGVVLQRWQKYDEALAAYEQAYRCKADDVSPLLAISEMLVKLGRMNEAMGRLEDKLIYFEHNAAIRMTLARLRLMTDQRAQAVKLYREASLLAPDDNLILEQLAFAEYASGHYTDAAYRFEKLLKVEGYEQRGDLQMALGDCHVANGELQRGGELFLRITRRDRDNAVAFIKLAQVAWMLDDFARVHEAADRVLALAPDRHEGHLLKGAALRHDGKAAEALARFDRATRLAPNIAVPHILKGMTYEQTGDRRAAAEAYRTALRIDPQDPRGRELLAGLENDSF